METREEKHFTLNRHFSAEVLDFRYIARLAPSGRWKKTLTDQRAATKAYTTSVIAQAIVSARVITRYIIVTDVGCLKVRPHEITVYWPILKGFGGGFNLDSPYEDLTIATPHCVMTGATLIATKYWLAIKNPWLAAIIV